MEDCALDARFRGHDEKTRITYADFGRGDVAAYLEVHSVMAKQRAPGRKRVEDGDTSSARLARPKRKRLSAAGSLTTCRQTVLSASN